VVGDVAHCYKCIPELILMMHDEATITLQNPLYDEYCLKLPAGIRDQIIASAGIPK